jgi:tRNA (guanine37-N1)-methyltransferase
MNSAAKPLLKFTVITLFAEALQPYLNTSMMWKAQDKGLVEFNFVNLRDFGIGPHKSVDDTPYGGGDGMLLRPEPIFAAVESIKKQDPEAEVILPTPGGMRWTQDLAKQFANQNMQDDQPKNAQDVDVTANNQNKPRHLIILCPRYEGYDQRILALVDYQISLGQYILTGGELPALIMIDSIVRLLPGVLGGESSAEIESFSDGNNIEYPQYTKPADFRGMKVPEVLLSGHHGKIAEWRNKHASQVD